MYASKLEQFNDSKSTNDSKRLKKRIFQQLGKLKRKFNELSDKSSNSNTADEAEMQKVAATTTTTTDQTDESEATQYTPSQAKMKLKLLHKELAQYAQKKLLNLAIKKFQWALRKGLPVNIHTYANMLNAYVRCGDIHGNFNLSALFLDHYNLLDNLLFTY